MNSYHPKDVPGYGWPRVELGESVAEYAALVDGASLLRNGVV